MSRYHRWPYIECKQGRHAVEVVCVVAHLHNPGYDSLLRPVRAKRFSQLPQVVCEGRASRDSEF